MVLNVITDFAKKHVQSLAGPPDAPVIQRNLPKVTAVSVNLIWLSGFNGGSTQTFTVICRPKDSENVIYSKEFTDPGYQKQGCAVVGNLTEQSEYRFTVFTQNRHPGKGNNTNKSETEMFMTKSKTYLSLYRFIFRTGNITQRLAKTQKSLKLRLLMNLACSDVGEMFSFNIDKEVSILSNSMSI